MDGRFSHVLVGFKGINATNGQILFTFALIKMHMTNEQGANKKEILSL